MSININKVKPSIIGYKSIKVLEEHTYTKSFLAMLWMHGHAVPLQLELRNCRMEIQRTLSWNSICNWTACERDESSPNNRCIKFDLPASVREECVAMSEIRMDAVGR